MKKKRINFLVMLLLMLIFVPAVLVYGADTYYQPLNFSYGSGNDATHAGFAGEIVPGVILFLNDRAEVGGWIDASSPNELRYARAYVFVYNKSGELKETWSYSSMGVWDSYDLGASMSTYGASVGTYYKMIAQCDIAAYQWSVALRREPLTVIRGHKTGE